MGTYVARPQVRTLLGVAAALEVRGRKTPEQQVAGFGSLRIFVTPRKVESGLAVQTHFMLSPVGKSSSKKKSKAGPTYEAEATLKSSPGTTSVMMLEADGTDRTILLLLTDVVSIQQVELPEQPLVASDPRRLPPTPVRQANVAQRPAPSAIQVSGYQAPPQVSPKSEVQQVLEEVREMRKLIQGLRDDMSRLRESVTQPERRTSKSDVWIQQGDSQVFARGKRIVSVSGHDPEFVNVTVLAADSLWLTGKKPGRTTLKCLFEGETSPESFLVEVIALPKRSGLEPLRQQTLVPRAADHLPGENPSQNVGRPISEAVALPKIPQTDVRIYENHLELIQRDKAISRIAIAAPAIVDITQYSATEIGITGLKPGSTTVLVWLDAGEEPERIIIEVLPARRVVSERFNSAVSPESAAARERIEQALSKETSIDIDDGTLLDALRQLQESAGVNIAVDSRALEEEGVSTDAKVSLHVAGVSLRSVLNLLLNEHDLATMIEDEALKVTSRQRAEGKQTVVAYRVEDLVDSGLREPGSFDELTSLITTLVRPESWQDVGGNGSVAANLPTGTLVIRQTQMVHAEIQQLFTALLKWKKSARTGAVSAPPIAVGVDELEGGRFSGFSPIEYSGPLLDTPNSTGRPILPRGDAVLKSAEPPGTTGAPIEAR